MMLNETPALNTLTPDEARLVFSEIYRSMPPGPVQVTSSDVEIPVSGGSIRGRVLTPSAPAKSLMVYYHGGGWVIGNIDDYDAVGRHLAEVCNSIVVMVDYRKAPEHRFPIPVDDCYAALEWADNHRSDMNALDLPMVVAGDSAGGNLSAVMAIQSRDEGGPKIDLQVLIYPVTNGKMDAKSWGDEDKQLFLTSDIMTFFWEHYADSRKDSIRELPHCQPMISVTFHRLSC